MNVIYLQEVNRFDAPASEIESHHVAEVRLLLLLLQAAVGILLLLLLRLRGHRRHGRPEGLLLLLTGQGRRGQDAAGLLVIKINIAIFS